MMVSNIITPGMAAILDLCKLTTFPGSKSWRLFICSSEGTNGQVKAKKTTIANSSRFGDFFSYYSWSTVENRSLRISENFTTLDTLETH